MAKKEQRKCDACGKLVVRGTLCEFCEAFFVCAECKKNGEMYWFESGRHVCKGCLEAIKSGKQYLEKVEAKGDDWDVLFKEGRCSRCNGTKDVLLYPCDECGRTICINCAWWDEPVFVCCECQEKSTGDKQ
jgi:hypothetical protein